MITLSCIFSRNFTGFTLNVVAHKQVRGTFLTKVLTDHSTCNYYTEVFLLSEIKEKQYLPIFRFHLDKNSYIYMKFIEI